MAATPGVQSVLARTKPWVRVCSVQFFCSAVMMIAIGLNFVGGGWRKISAAAFFPITAAAYFFAGLYLFQYASRIGDYLTGGDDLQLETALRSQRSFWMLFAVLSALQITMEVIAIVAAIATTL